MKKAFLYIDILGFGQLVKNNSLKVDKIFEIIDGLSVHKHFALKTIVFSDTILVFNKKDEHSNDYYVTYLIEYAQQLFYRLSHINIYFKGIITLGEFNYSNLKNIEAYYGLALIDTYNDESKLDGFGLYINKNLSQEVIVFEKIEFSDKYDYILLCQSFISLYKITEGNLPLEINLLSETDAYHRIDEDLRFFREIEYLKNHLSIEKHRKKYDMVYELYKKEAPLFFEYFEKDGFLPFILNSDYTGSINPFELLAESEMNKSS
jgi:hypothetical protein